jgi:hypothetical protein
MGLGVHMNTEDQLDVRLTFLVPDSRPQNPLPAG